MDENTISTNYSSNSFYTSRCYLMNFVLYNYCKEIVRQNSLWWLTFAKPVRVKRIPEVQRDCTFCISRFSFDADIQADKVFS